MPSLGGGAGQQAGGSTGRGDEGSDLLNHGFRGNGGQDGNPGHNGYGSNNNLLHDLGLGRPPGEFEAPRLGTNNRIILEGNREDRVRMRDNRYRNGYWHYDRNWCDDNFWYPFYGFAWYSGCNYIPSPFYCYYHLPAYIDCVRVQIGPISWMQCSTRYAYRHRNYDGWGQYDDNASDLDYAVDSITEAFERGNARYVSSLVSPRTRVQVDAGWDNQYTVNGDDFYEMFRDLVEGTRTTGYRIDDVYSDDGRATVYATHDYTDSWGREQRVRHTYGLQITRHGYEIVYFKTTAR